LSQPDRKPQQSNKPGLYASLRRRGVIRVAVSYALIAWLLLQIGDVVFEPIGAPDWAMRALIVVLAAGFPFALLLAWFFEITPGGIERDHLPQQATRPAVRGVRRYADVLIIGILLVAVLFLLAREQGWVEQAQAPPVIAVLPFAELGAAENTYFGAGLADTLIQKLGQLSQLVVLASNSTFEFQGPALDLRTTGAKLGANSILQGTVQRAGRQLRINARLVDVASGRQLWSGSYERPDSDLFAVQDEIAGAVTEALQVVLSPDDTSRLGNPTTLSLTAYDAYLLGQAKLAERDTSNIGESVEYFRQAIRLDPEYALAHAALAEAIYLTASYGPWETNWDITGPEAHRAAATAQSLNPELGEAYVAQAVSAIGDNQFGDESIWPDAHIAALLTRAIQLSPNNAAALKWFAQYAANPDEALSALLRAAQLDPRSSIIRMNIGEQYRGRGEFDLARDWMLKAAEANDRVYLQAYRSIGSMYFRDAVRLDEAARWGNALRAKHPDDWSADPALIRPLIELGLWDEAWRIWEERPMPAATTEAEPSLRFRLFDGARLAAARGDIDSAERLAKSFSQNYFETLSSWPDLSSIGHGQVWTVMLDIQAMADVLRGQPAAALRRYEASLPDSMDWYYWSYMSVYLPTPVMMAALCRMTGDPGRADRILRDFLARTGNEPIKGDPGLGFLRFMLHAALGETDAAIASLEEALAAGWLPGWWNLKAGAFDSNYAAALADPRFQELFQEIEARVALARESYLADPALPEGMQVR